jgi:hypothetical protein
MTSGRKNETLDEDTLRALERLSRRDTRNPTNIKRYALLVFMHYFLSFSL